MVGRKKDTNATEKSSSSKTKSNNKDLTFNVIKYKIDNCPPVSEINCRSFMKKQDFNSYNKMKLKLAILNDEIELYKKKFFFKKVICDEIKFKKIVKVYKMDDYLCLAIKHENPHLYCYKVFKITNCEQLDKINQTLSSVVHCKKGTSENKSHAKTREKPAKHRKEHSNNDELENNHSKSNKIVISRNDSNNSGRLENNISKEKHNKQRRSNKCENKTKQNSLSDVDDDFDTNENNQNYSEFHHEMGSDEEPCSTKKSSKKYLTDIKHENKKSNKFGSVYMFAKKI